MVSKLNTINETPSEDESKMNDYSVNTPSYPVNNISEEVIIEDKNKNNDLTKEQIKEENNDKPCDMDYDIDYIPEPWEQLYDNIGRPYFFNKCTCKFYKYNRRRARQFNWVR